MAAEYPQAKYVADGIRRLLKACELYTGVECPSFIQASGHTKVIYAIMYAFLKEIVCEMAYSFQCHFLGK
jgi:hypothetical protein